MFIIFLLLGLVYSGYIVFVRGRCVRCGLLGVVFGWYEEVVEVFGIVVFGGVYFVG